jgi:hypothetical protein
LVECAFVHRECRYFSADRHRATGAAGVSQPWWANVLGRGKTRAIANAFRSHGGLTPAALGRTYVCALQKSLFRRQTFALQHKSGGRKPPVAPINAIATAIHAHARTPSAICRRTTLLSADTHLPAHGGLTCAALDESVRNCIFALLGTHGGLTPAALGAFISHT